MDPLFEHRLQQTRRQFFGSAALNFGGVAMGMLAAQSGFTESNSFAAAPSSPIAEQMHKALAGYPHHTPKAKAIIYLHMNGAPSQIDTWDYKPELAKHFD